MTTPLLYPPHPRMTRDNLRSWAGLVVILSQRNFRARFLRMRFGTLWSVMQPVVQAAVLSVVFLKVFHVKVAHYPAYVLSGVMTWQCFQQATVQCAQAAIDNAPLIKKVPVPATVFPLAAVGGQLIAFSRQFIVLLAIALVDGHVTWKIALLPLAVLLLTAAALSIGLLVGAYLPEIRELRILLDTGLLLAFYATPVLYNPAILPDTARKLLYLNPMAGVLEIFRAGLLGRPTDGAALLISVVAVVPLLAAGLITYHRRSGGFADLM